MVGNGPAEQRSLGWVDGVDAGAEHLLVYTEVVRDFRSHS